MLKERVVKKDRAKEDLAKEELAKEELVKEEKHIVLNVECYKSNYKYINFKANILY
jgi:ribosome-binding protein aMBF1 (putative translation factor)